MQEPIEMPNLSTAFPFGANLPKPKKKKPKKRPLIVRIVICGLLNWKGKGGIKKALKEFSYTEVNCVIIGTRLGGIDPKLLSVCRELKFNVLQVQINTQRNGYNAQFYRNEWVWRNLKPTHLLVFANVIPDKKDDDLTLDQKNVLDNIKLAKAAKVDFIHVEK